jgi:hypothetical protein
MGKLNTPSRAGTPAAVRQGPSYTLMANGTAPPAQGLCLTWSCKAFANQHWRAWGVEALLLIHSVAACHAVLQAMLSDSEQVTVPTATLSCIIDSQGIQ